MEEAPGTKLCMLRDRGSSDVIISTPAMHQHQSAGTLVCTRTSTMHFLHIDSCFYSPNGVDTWDSLDSKHTLAVRREVGRTGLRHKAFISKPTTLKRKNVQAERCYCWCEKWTNERRESGVVLKANFGSSNRSRGLAN